jgi:hypothetical protein
VGSRWAWSILIGFIGIVCIPVAVVILLVTVVGIPLAMALLAAYFLLLLFGYASSGVAAGGLALRRLAPQRSSLGWRVLAAAVCMALIILAGRIPILGGIVVLVALLTGVGALLLQLRGAAAGARA